MNGAETLVGHVGGGNGNVIGSKSRVRSEELWIVVKTTSAAIDLRRQFSQPGDMDVSKCSELFGETLPDRLHMSRGGHREPKPALSTHHEPCTFGTPLTVHSEL